MSKKDKPCYISEPEIYEDPEIVMCEKLNPNSGKHKFCDIYQDREKQLVKDVPYTKNGCRKIGEDVWHPHWNISYWSHPTRSLSEKTIFFGAFDNIDLLEKLKEISRDAPGQNVWLNASARVRAVARDGEIIKERTYDEFYTTEDKYGEECRRIFDGLIICDSDGMGKFLLPDGTIVDTSE